MMVFQGTWVLMGAGGRIGVVGVEYLPLLTKLLLCVLQTTNFFLLLVNLFLLHPGSSVTGLPDMALNPLLLTRCALHQEGFAQAGLCWTYVGTNPIRRW